MIERNVNAVYSLLERISSKQVKDLIIQCQLLGNGYTIHYIIDPFDLQNYCFPFGIGVDSYSSLQKIAQTADNMLGLHYVFDNPNHTLILFHEYFEELSDFEWYVHQNMEKRSNAADTFWQSFNPENIEVGSAEFYEKTNFALLIAISVDLYHEGLQKITYLRDTKQSGRLIYEVEGKTNAYNGAGHWGWDILFNTKPEQQGTNEILRSLVRMTKVPEKMLHTIDFSNPPLWFRRELKAKNRDSKVIDRLLRINNRLNTLCIESGQDGELVAYLSSPDSSKELFLQPSISDRFPVLPVEGYVFNPLRTAEQLFLLLLCEDNTDSNLTLENLNLVYELRWGQEQSGEYDPALLSLVSGWMKARLDISRQSSRNYSLLDNIEQYKQEADALAERKGYDEQKRVLEHLRQYVAKNRQKIHEIKKERFSLLNYEEMFLTILNLGLRNLSQDNMLSSNHGQDRVKGLYHRLPVVFFTQKPGSDRSVLTDLVEFMLEPDEKKHKEDLNKIILQTTGNLVNPADASIEFEIVRYLLILLFPRFDDQVNISPDEVVFKHLFPKIENLAYQKPVEYRTDLLYVMAWVARRLTRYKEALDFSKAGQDMAPEDPRFYHSICLIEYCRFNPRKEKTEQIAQLELILSISQTAYDKYTELEKKQPGNIAIQKSKAALKNTRIYIKCLLYELTNDASWLERAEERLRELEKEERENFVFLPDFLHTKAFLLYFRAIIHRQKSEINQAENCVREGEEALERLVGKITAPAEKEDLTLLRSKFSQIKDQIEMEKANKA